MYTARMILYPNHKVSLFRWDAYATTVDSNIDVYVYEQSDELDAMNGVEWAQNEMRLLTVFTGMQTGDKIVDELWNIFIVKKVKHRDSFFASFYEVQVRSEHD